MRRDHLVKILELLMSDPVCEVPGTSARHGRLLGTKVRKRKPHIDMERGIDIPTPKMRKNDTCNFAIQVERQMNKRIRLHPGSILANRFPHVSRDSADASGSSTRATGAG